MPNPDRPHVDLTATCACGQIRLRFAGDVLSMFCCACEDCQRATGSGHSTVALVRRAGLTVSDGARSFARPANSGATLTRHFCPTCGTPLYAQSSRAETLAMLPVGLFGAASDWYRPGQVIFWRSHRDWDSFPTDIPHYTTYRDEETGH